MYLEKCPVCNGKGIVPNGFYTTNNNFYYSNTTCGEICRSCYGKGYISIPTNDVMDTIDSSNIGINYIDNMKFDRLNIGDIVYVESKILKDCIKEQYDVDVSKYDYIQCKIWDIINKEIYVYVLKGDKYNYIVLNKDIYKVIPGDAKVCYYDDEDYQIGDVVYKLCHTISKSIESNAKIISKFEVNGRKLYDIRLASGNIAYGVPEEFIYKYPDLIEKYMGTEKELTSSDNKHIPKFDGSQNLILNPIGLEMFNKSIADLNLSDEVKVELIDYLYYDELNNCEWYYVKIPEIYNIVCVFPDMYISIKNDTIVIRNLEDTIPLMNSSDYKDRFVAEYLQLCIRKEKLYNTISKYNEGELEFGLTCTTKILEEQYDLMYKYAEKLEERAKIEDINLNMYKIELE